MHNTTTDESQAPANQLPGSGWGAGSTAVRAPQEGPRATTSRTHAHSAHSTPPQDGARLTPPQTQSNQQGRGSHARRTGHESADDQLVCISANVQRSAANTSLLLEEFRGADVVCVQEIFWGHIKTVASSTNPAGASYENTVAHPDYLCLGASASSRIATYIHKRWASAQPTIRAGILAHNDVALVSLTLPRGAIHFLNVYNDPKTHAAVATVLDHVDRLPEITFMAGDFNLRHEMWQPQSPGDTQRQRRAHVGASDDLIHLATTELQLALLNDPVGIPTWTSNNPRLRPGVLDLVWVNPLLGDYRPLDILLDHQYRSDHAILRWTLPLADKAQAEPVIGRNSAAAQAYLDDLSKSIASLPTQFSDREAVEQTGERLQAILDAAWVKHSAIPNRSAHSKSWWDTDCAVRANALRRERQALREARHAKRTAAQAHQTQHLRDLQLRVNKLAKSCDNIQHSLRSIMRQTCLTQDMDDLSLILRSQQSAGVDFLVG